MLFEAAWAAARAPGPLRAFFLWVRARRGQHVAAVATARKLATLVYRLLRWGQEYVDIGQEAYERLYAVVRLRRVTSTAAQLGYRLIKAKA